MAKVDSIAELWLTAAGHSLWEHLDGEPIPWRKVAWDRFALSDPRAEALLIGSLLVLPEATRPPTAEVDWKAVAKGFTQSELPKALFEACRTYWTAKGLNQDEVREAFRLVRDDYHADPDQCLADMSDLARKATAKEKTE